MIPPPRFPALLAAFALAGSSLGIAQEALPSVDPPRKIQALARHTGDDRTGRGIEAEVLGAAEGQVEMKLADGRTISIPYARLSDADQAYLRKLRDE